MSSTRILTALVTAVLMMASACSAQSDEPDPLREAAPNGTAQGSATVQSDALVAALSEGEIDHDKYLAGYRRFSDCMRSEGYPLTMESENNLVMSYSVAVGPAEIECYESEFKPLDVAWQVHQEDTSETAEVMRRCLTRLGVTPRSTLASMNQQLIDEEIGLEECLESDG